MNQVLKTPSIKPFREKPDLEKAPVAKVQTQDLIIKSRFIRIAPRKLRLVANCLKNKKVSQALNILSFTPKAASLHLQSVLKSGQAQAKDRNYADNLYIKTIAVNEGPRLKRRRIIHRNRATSILKRRSHITVVLSEQQKSEARSSKSEK